MPLARIISRRSEDALPLVNELHAQGYEVEVFAPDEPMEGEADVELVIETAPAEQAAEIVESRARENPDLFVAPGIIVPVVDQKAMAAAARATEEAAARARLQREREEQERIAAEQRRVAEEQRRLAEERERQRVAAEAAERERIAAEQRRVAEEQRRLAEERERQRLAAEAAERERVAAEQQRLAEERERERQRVAAELAARERREAEARRLAEAEALRMREEQDRLARAEKERRDQAERARIAREAEEERQRHALESQRRAAAAAQEEQNRTALRRVEEAANLRAAALEQERRREAQVQAQGELDARAELERAATEAQHRADEESRARAEEDAARERKAREERERYRIEPPLAAPSPWYGGEGAYAAGMDYAAKVEPAFRGIRITRGHRHAGAAVAATVIAISLALGWAAVSNRRPANPLGVSNLVQQQNVDQQTPFGSATIKPAGNNQPVAASHQLAARQSAPGHQSGAESQHKPAAAHVRRAQKRSDDDVANDVVVRHFNAGRPVPAKAQQKQQAGLKKISDLN